MSGVKSAVVLLKGSKDAWPVAINLESCFKEVEKVFDSRKGEPKEVSGDRLMTPLMMIKGRLEQLIHTSEESRCSLLIQGDGIIIKDLSLGAEQLASAAEKLEPKVENTDLRFYKELMSIIPQLQAVVDQAHSSAGPTVG